MTTNVERIEARIAEARKRIEEIGPEIEELDAQTGEVAAAEHVDELQLGKLTDQRMQRLKHREWRELEIKTLETQLADAARKDAEEALREIEGEYVPLVERAKPAVKRLEKALTGLENAIPGAFEPAAKATALRGRAQRLAKEHGLEMPHFAPVPQPSAALVERCRTISPAIDEREGEIVRRDRNARRAITRLEAEEHRKAKQERRAKEREEAQQRGNTIWSESMPVVAQ